jgi:hypothetical protein
VTNSWLDELYGSAFQIANDFQIIVFPTGIDLSPEWRIYPV